MIQLHNYFHIFILIGYGAIESSTTYNPIVLQVPRIILQIPSKSCSAKSGSVSYLILAIS